MRELQLWDEKHYVRAKREGNQRVWSDDDLRVVRYIVGLRKIGLSIRRIEPLLPLIRDAAGANRLWLVKSQPGYVGIAETFAGARKKAESNGCLIRKVEVK